MYNVVGKQMTFTVNITSRGYTKACQPDFFRSVIPESDIGKAAIYN